MTTTEGPETTGYWAQGEAYANRQLRAYRETRRRRDQVLASIAEDALWTLESGPQQEPEFHVGWATAMYRWLETQRRNGAWE